MTEPKLTVGRVQTWRPLDPDDYDDIAVQQLARDTNRRLAELFPPAPPQPEAAKPEPEPDYTCPKCGEDNGDHDWCSCRTWEITAAANARIRELERERDEDAWHAGWQVAMHELTEARVEAHKAHAAGAAAMREAIAKRLEEAAERWLNSLDAMGQAKHFSLTVAATIARETEVPHA